MGMGSDSNGWSRARGLVLKTIVLIGGALLLKRLTKTTTRWDHARIVSQSLSGQKFSREQASRNPDNYFNLSFVRDLFLMAGILENSSEALPAGEILTDSWLQRFYMVKPCPKEMKCDVELSSFAIRDAEEYKNFCDRPKDQRPLPEEVIGVSAFSHLRTPNQPTCKQLDSSTIALGLKDIVHDKFHWSSLFAWAVCTLDIAEHLTTIYIKRCERGKRCLYEGSTPPDGFPNSWNGATYCTSELSVLKNNEIHTWDRGYDDDGNQVWGVKEGPYEFKPAPVSSFNDMLSPLHFPPPTSMEKRIEGSFALTE
ncbi:hypothetical protein HHK36_015961 [Tetracentron sinense]|uniref:Uncharacterized protein n=1 Tax=Tetracentron sinense TaxID=13715 RepID=A0A834ZA49_TETSI|nr:hypothetical protein HHK36_015961 [Tetracentron sinense]